MRIGILVFQQPENSTPEHFISKEMKGKFLGYRPNGKAAVVPLAKNLLKIVLPITFQKLKSLFRAFERDSKPRYQGGMPFIPGKLPSHKIPGTTTKGPVVEKSRLGIFRIMQANHIVRQEANS